jgi:quinol monooxygenase YgiN
MAIGVTAKLFVQADKNAEFEEIFKRLAAAVDAHEPGCDFYHLYKLRSKDNAYMVLEQYADETALSAHQVTDHYKSIGAELGGVMAAAPEITLMDSV